MRVGRIPNAQSQTDAGSHFTGVPKHRGMIGAGNDQWFYEVIVL